MCNCISSRYPYYVTKADKTKVFEFSLDNDRESSLLSKKMSQYPVIVMRDGLVLWNGVIHVSLNCQMDDISKFPFDDQECPLKWVTVPSLPPRKNITFYPLPSEDNIVKKSSVYWKLQSYEYESGRGQYVLKLRRLSQNALASLVIPFVSFNVLVGVVYILPSTSGERVGYSITLVLSFSVLLMGINNVVPSTDKMISIGEYFCHLFFLAQPIDFFVDKRQV